DFNTVICTPLLHLCNDPSYAEAVVRALQLDSWTDLLPTFTSWTQLGIGILKQRLDWLFAKGVSPVSYEVRQDILVVDHVPVMADFGLL
ncbi:MAG: hypothetical protein JRI23_30505, partial [Deltaproteobacteria bacterium]|nr:hypothetical protein [Deltaproteobacteria bacterium]MBW2536514.1 hypothetical protein [Deltaproteobacteria bacterium]